jgi:hypothetical protein
MLRHQVPNLKFNRKWFSLKAISLAFRQDPEHLKNKRHRCKSKERLNNNQNYRNNNDPEENWAV